MQTDQMDPSGRHSRSLKYIEDQETKMKKSAARDCNFCTVQTHTSIKTCSQCLASYCEEHLRSPWVNPDFKAQKKIDPPRNLDRQVCTRHSTLSKYFFWNEQRVICASCSREEREEREVVRAEKMKELEVVRRSIRDRMENTEGHLKLIREEFEVFNVTADEFQLENDKLFAELFGVTERKRSGVKLLTRGDLDHERNAVMSFIQEANGMIQTLQAKEVLDFIDLQKKLELEVAELKRRDVELEQLSRVENHTEFLQNFLNVASEPVPAARFDVSPTHKHQEMMSYVTAIKNIVKENLRERPGDNLLTRTRGEVFPSEPVSRNESMKHQTTFRLEPTTANNRIVLSKNRRKVTLTRNTQLYVQHPDRFTDEQQVLSSHGVTGRLYWEVEWRGRGVCVAVAYKTVSREGRQSRFGSNDKSWSLLCSRQSCIFRHDGVSATLAACLSSRVGVYLDHGAGVLVFYSVSETMTVLHRVRTRFTEPLHAGISFCFMFSIGDSAEFRQ